MARPSPQSFEKRQREIRKRRKREEKLERRLWRNEEKRIAKEGGEAYGAYSEYEPRSEDEGQQPGDQASQESRGSAPPGDDAPRPRE